MNETLLVGVVVGVFGLRGELKVKVETEFPERFDAGAIVLLQDASGSRPVRIESSRSHKGQMLVKLAGVNNPDDAALYRGRELHVPMTDRKPLPPDTFYLHELEGLNVFETGTGRPLGQVVEIWQPGGADVYVVAAPGQRRWMIPAVAQFVNRIDVGAGAMWVTVDENLQE